MAQIIVMSAILSVHWRRCKLGADHTVCVPAVVGEIDRRFKYYHDIQLHRMCVVYSSAGGSFELSSCNEFSREDVKRILVKQRRNNNKASFSAEEKADLYAEVNALYEASYALQHYDLPLWQRDGPGNASHWRCEVGPVRAFLRDVIGPVRNQGFPLVSLPAELGLQIYEHALQYPTSGLSLDSRRGRFRLGKIKHISLEWSMKSKKRPQTLYTEHTADILALLLVSKDVFEEAMPIFYRDNSFHAASPLQLIDLLRGCGARRRKYFTNIYVDCSRRSDAAPAELAFRLLAGVPGFRSLALNIWDLQWLSKETPQITRRGLHINPELRWDASEKPALIELGKCKVHQIQFHGECPQIIAYVKEHVVRPTDVAKRMLVLEQAEKEGNGAPETDGREHLWRSQHGDQPDPRAQSFLNLEKYFARFGRTTVVDF
ncbi:hypothetical protein LTR95_015312 [Oleoguttula sp. CCFEE 5521]